MKTEDLIAVLQEAKMPLTSKEILKELRSRRMRVPGGRTPEQTIAARIYVDIKRNGDNSPFCKVPKKALFYIRPNYPTRKRRIKHDLIDEDSLLSFTDSAEYILDTQADGKPLHYREITQKALECGVLHTKGKTPERTLYAAVKSENKRREAKAERPRFTFPSKGMIGLAEWKKSGLNSPVDVHNKKVKEKILRILRRMHFKTFEGLVERVLASMGFSGTSVTKATRDGGIDVRGTLCVADAIKMPIAVQVKRYATSHVVGSPAINELRGALCNGERGVFVTTSSYTDPAKKSADNKEKTGGKVDLIDGEMFVDLMVMHGIWVKREKRRKANEPDKLIFNQDTEDE